MACQERIDDYFLRRPIECQNSSCGQSVDWWRAAVETACGEMANPILWFALIGAHIVAFPIELTPGTEYNLAFADHGVPDSAKILVVGYTPHGGSLFPVEIHGNIPQRHLIPSVVRLYPRPFTPDTTPGPTKVMVMVQWVEARHAGDLWQQLVSAFEALAVGKFSEAIIPAHIAVEARLNRLMSRLLEGVASRERVDRFLADAATYSHQLNVLLPALLEGRQVPRLPEHIRGLLNRLRSLRNDLVHDGYLSDTLDSRSVAELLCAALFSFHYLRLAESMVTPRETPTA